MSYRTRYSLTWDDALPEPIVAQIMANWRELRQEVRTAIDLDGSSEERTCWYEHEADLKILSLAGHGTLFTLDCVGEDGQRWRVVAKDGRVFRITPQTIWCGTPISPESIVQS
jgi:hypothetical protein